MRNGFAGQGELQEHLEHCYEAWKHVPRRAHRIIHLQALVAENWYTEVEPRHANRSGDKEITKYQPVGSKLTPWLQNLSGYAEGRYGVDGPYYDVAIDLEALYPKSRPLEHYRFGGVGTLLTLIACPNGIRRNLAPWQHEFCQI